MSDHEKNIKKIESLIAIVGEDNFKKAIEKLLKRSNDAKKQSCNHNWKLSQICGDGYNCQKCGSWKPEDL